jgi:transposase
VGPDAATCTKSRDVIEGPWTYCMQVRVSRKLHDRLEALPQDTCDVVYKAQVFTAAAGERLLLG